MSAIIYLLTRYKTILPARTYCDNNAAARQSKCVQYTVASAPRVRLLQLLLYTYYNVDTRLHRTK